MSFKDVNITKRLRYPVRGRVIVNTTSAIVEYVNDSLTQSVALYSFAAMPWGRLATFMVELDGFLTFDKDAYVQITPELNPFREVYFRPTEWALTNVGDEFPGTITSIAVVYEPFTPIITGSTRGVKKALIGVTYAPGLVKNYIMSLPNYVVPTELGPKINFSFVTGAIWLGANAYAGWSQVSK
jgi:hypothetical protein